MRLRRRCSGLVTEAEGRILAREIGAAAYVECSSLTMESIQEVFQSVVSLALKDRKKKSSIIRRFLRR